MPHLKTVLISMATALAAVAIASRIDPLAKIVFNVKA